MFTKSWRERLTYAAMSMFVAWHTIAMVVAPASAASAIAQSLRVVLTPYLTLFELDHKWQFFAPNIARGDQLRYVIADASGRRHTFVPSANWHWFYTALLGWDQSVLDDPDTYAAPVATFLCREHAALRPVSITFLQVQEKEFTPEDHLNGNRPLDPEFTTVHAVRRIKCPRS
jgi:hypothetical protein